MLFNTVFNRVSRFWVGRGLLGGCCGGVDPVGRTVRREEEEEEDRIISRVWFERGRVPSPTIHDGAVTHGMNCALLLVVFYKVQGLGQPSNPAPRTDRPWTQCHIRSQQVLFNNTCTAVCSCFW